MNTSKCANAHVQHGAGMDLSNNLAMARDHAGRLSTTLDDAVSGYVLGGWKGVAALAAFALVMFLLTSLFTRRD